MKRSIFLAGMAFAAAVISLAAVSNPANRLTPQRVVATVSAE